MNQRKKLAALIVLWLLMTALGLPAFSADVEVYFSPHGGCTEAAVAQIDKAKDTIRMQAYALTSEPIADALVAAAKRGVDVQVCVDERVGATNAKFVGPQLKLAGVKVLLDGKHPISHSKTITVDSTVVVTGSFNWSKNAESNLENLLVIHDATLAKKYEANWSEHAAHCVPFKPK